MTDTNDRSGHRMRVRKRIAADGTDWMNETDLLEALLFGAVARRDTRPIAESLIGRFGSLKAVLAAPFSEIFKKIDRQRRYFVILVKFPTLRDGSILYKLIVFTCENNRNLRNVVN